MAHRSPEVAPDPTSTFPCIPICKSERVLLARASAVWQTTNLLRVRACCVEIHHLGSIDSIRRPVTSWIVRVIARRDTVSNKVRNRWVVVDDEVPQHSHERKDLHENISPVPELSYLVIHMRLRNPCCNIQLCPDS